MIQDDHLGRRVIHCTSCGLLAITADLPTACALMGAHVGDGCPPDAVCAYVHDRLPPHLARAGVRRRPRRILRDPDTTMP
jgi:hypothetical protein